MGTVLSTVYSQPSIDKVKQLVNTFLDAFGHYTIDFDDMFYYGIFCSASTYANYDWDGLVNQENDFEIPFNLYAPCTTSEDRIEYVENIIEAVMKNEIQKPGWMKFIEMESSCDCYNVQPSNFLRLYPKKEEYKGIGESLIEFLYSPNRTQVVY